MSKVIVAGITQLETIVKVPKIPIEYHPSTGLIDAIFTAAGGDAFNISLAMKWLGDDVKFMTVVGRGQDYGIFNPPGNRVILETEYIMPIMKETPKEVLLFDRQRRQQKFEDLKDIRDAKYNMAKVEPIIDDVDLVFLSNANFCRPFIQLAKEHGKMLAVKIHTFSRDKEVYNEDYLSSANILYFDDNSIREDPYNFIQDISRRYDPEIIIIGQGVEGVILYDREHEINVHYNMVQTGQVVNTAGSGNAMFACFLHYYLKTQDSKMAIRKAMIFTANKIGYNGTSNGFMTEDQLEQWEKLIWDPRNTSQWGTF